MFQAATKVFSFLRLPGSDVSGRGLVITVLNKVAGPKGRVRRNAMAADLVKRKLFADRSRIYLAYRPDAECEFDRFPEFEELSASWINNNIENNMGDLPRLYALMLNIRQTMAESIPGDFAELGVYKGNSAAVLAHYARLNARSVFLFDTYEGFERSDLVGMDSDKQDSFLDTSLDLVKQNVGVLGVDYVKGYFPATVTASIADRQFAVVHLDCDLYEPMKAGLDFFYPRLSAGGLLLIHDYSNPHWGGVKRAVDEFLPHVGERLVLIPDKSGTAIIRKSA